MAKKKKRKRRLKKWVKKFLWIMLVIIIVLVLGILGSKYIDFNDMSITDKENKLDIEKVKNSYNKYVKTSKDTKLYLKENEEYLVSGNLSSNIELELLEVESDSITDEYFKLANLDYYVKYDSLEKIESFNIDTRYKNYIVFNESIITNDSTKLYVDDNNYYQVNSSLTLPIIVKENGKYGIEYDNRLVYVKLEDVKEVISSDNTTMGHTNGIAVLNYHYTINKEAKEHLQCVDIICMEDTLFDAHIKYIKDNGFYSASMKDFEMFIDGKIQLPEKTVLITIDDGWYVSRAIGILNKHQILGTLFLIGSLQDAKDFASPYLEVHSHTWDLHDRGVCSGGQGAPLKCTPKEEALADLKKSRESLNNTPYFCWPFYEYNNYAIDIIKEAGFTMAFAGGQKKAKVGIDKYTIPRYVMYKSTSVNELARIIN